MIKLVILKCLEKIDATFWYFNLWIHQAKLFIIGLHKWWMNDNEQDNYSKTRL